MRDQSGPYFEKYDSDFGLSGLTESFALSTPPGTEEAALGLLTGKLAAYEGEAPVDMSGIERLGEEERRILGFDVFHDDFGYAEELRADLGSLLEAPLSDEVLGAVWVAATGGAWDPKAHGIGVRDWLARMDATCAARPPRAMVGRAPGPSWSFWRLPAVATVREAILAEIRASTGELPGLAPALEEVATRADLDLGFRLYLRALKTAAVPVPEVRCNRFCELGAPFGYHFQVVYEGLTVVWQPLEVARRLFDGDFGLSELAGQFDPMWERSVPAPELLHRTVIADGYHVPGVQALVLWEDSVRLLRSPLSGDTLTTLWFAASNTDPGRSATDGPAWLRRIAEECRTRLTEVAPGHTPALPPVRADLADAVLPELREAAPLLEPEHATALEQVVVQVDPDLGFRLLIRVLHTASGSLSKRQYARCRALGERFGHGEDHVSHAIEHLVQDE
ncbi:hypothetical protein [Streptomyces guryensis]|uniref:Uncharacterized protein n=1 Tax=Streptomyces guryensis TaxID=2886947 RepID=A0A9Q3Z7T0_9ACTN|nr:hypothetical protein [Streptomyces guryensis]MCD9878546.1 hypothetical protein [Streptomyces guryensis]